MAEIPTGEYVHRSIDQLRSMNERGTLGAVIHDYKQFTDLRNNIVTDYTIKNSLNNNNNLIDNRNTSASIHNQSPALDQKHQQHYISPTTPPTPLSITDAQMNDAKVSENVSIRVNNSCAQLLQKYLRCGNTIELGPFRDDTKEPMSESEND